MTTTSDTSKLGARLLAARQARGLALRDVARKARVSPATLSRCERGAGAISAENLRKLAIALDVSIGWVYGGAAVRRTELEPEIVWRFRAGGESVTQIAQAFRRDQDYVEDVLRGLK